MREIEKHAIEDLGIHGSVLTENAARSVADWLTENIHTEKSAKNSDS